MRTQLEIMLALQDGMNQKVTPDWLAQGYAWHRAIWVECAELLDHYGFKWWKQQQPDMGQVRLEIIDIWHFGLSSLFRPGKAPGAIADDVVQALAGRQSSGLGVRESTEQLALHALAAQTFSIPAFWDLMEAADMDFDQLYRGYIGKNVLNFFRQDHGYKEGSYRKLWAGREDNEHLLELAQTLDASSPSYKDALYQALKTRYLETA